MGFYTEMFTQNGTSGALGFTLALVDGYAVLNFQVSHRGSPEKHGSHSSTNYYPGSVPGRGTALCKMESASDRQVGSDA